MEINILTVFKIEVRKYEHHITNIHTKRVNFRQFVGKEGGQYTYLWTVEEFIFEEILAEHEPLLNVLPVDFHVIDGQDLLMVFQTPLWNSNIVLLT